MLSMQTRDNWAAAQVTIQVGVNADLWTGSASLSSSVDALQDLAAWANAGARPWAGLALFSWGWLRQAATGGALLKLTNSGGVFSFSPNGAAGALMGLPAAVGVLTVTGTLPAVGTWAPGPTGYLALQLGVTWLQGAGQASGVGAVRPGVPGLAAWVASCRPVVEAQDCARLTAILERASHPRRAWLRESNVTRSTESVTPPGDLAGWRLVALGPVQRQRQGVSLWQCDLAMAGEAV